MPKRFWELDFARGFALVLMIIFNYAFALQYFGVYTLTSSEIFWFWFPRLIGALFIFIAGLSLSLSYSGVKNKKRVYRKYAKRGSGIFLLGMAITLVTWIFVPGQTIFFGILHLIGLSIIIAPPFFLFKNANLFTGLSIIIVGIYLQKFSFDFPWLLWIGLQPKNFVTLDYFPLMPWFGFVLLGIFIGNILYKNGRQFKIRDFSKNTLVSFLCFLGRNSLIIYLIHIPVLLLALFLAGFPVLQLL